MNERYQQITIDQYLRRTQRFEGVGPSVTKKLEKSKNIIDEVIGAVARDFCLAPEDLIGSSRREDVVLARHTAAYVLFSQTDLSFKAIALSLGRNDHTTTINALGNIDKLIKEDPDFKERLGEISSRFSDIAS